ncbi:Hypothetical predicted protein, partial [Pelobates cultripes]
MWEVIPPIVSGSPGDVALQTNSNLRPAPKSTVNTQIEPNSVYSFLYDLPGELSPLKIKLYADNSVDNTSRIHRDSSLPTGLSNPRLRSRKDIQRTSNQGLKLNSC